MPDEILSLGRWAEVMAYKREYPGNRHAEILAKLGVSADEVAASSAYWARTIAEPLAGGDPTLACEFVQVYAEVLEAVRLRHPPVAKIAPNPKLVGRGPAIAAAAPAPSVKEAPATATPTAPKPEPAGAAVPTYLRPSHEALIHAVDPPAAATLPDPSAAPPGAGTEDISSFVPRGAALPFLHRQGPPPVVAATEPASTADAAPGSGTADLGQHAAGAATPFGPGDAAAQAAAAGMPRMRLVRFDPQTGQPLAEPRWVEVTADPPKP